MKLLIIGEDNPYTPGDDHFALYPYPRGVSGDRLRRVMGLTDTQYLSLPRTNLCASSWGIREARGRADSITAELSAGVHDVLIWCGSKVRRSFGCPDGEPVPSVVDLNVGGHLAQGSPSWWRVEGGRRSGGVAVLLPHPSGRSRAWNQADMVGLVRAVLRRAAPWVPWGTAGDRFPDTKGEEL